jgi:hypothetical protein
VTGAIQIRRLLFTGVIAAVIYAVVAMLTCRAFTHGEQVLGGALRFFGRDHLDSIPYVNDCHQPVNDCLDKRNFKNPGLPGGRWGDPCDPCDDKKK